MFVLFVCVESLPPDTGNMQRFLDFLVLFFVLFSCCCLSVLSCVLFAGESLLSCAPRVGSDGVRLNIKYLI